MHCAALPGALDHLVFRANVQELTVILSALALSKEMAKWHTLHVILMQVLAHVPLLALTSQPVLADVRPLDTLVPHRTFVSSFAHAFCMPAQT